MTNLLLLWGSIWWDRFGHFRVAGTGDLGKSGGADYPITLDIDHLYPIIDDWGAKIFVSSKTPPDWHGRRFTQQELEAQIDLMLPSLEIECGTEIRRVISDLLACVDTARNLLSAIEVADEN